MIPPPLTRQYIRVPQSALLRRNTSVLAALLNAQIDPDRLKVLRRAIDVRFDVSAQTNILADPAIRQFLRGAEFGAGFFLPLRSPALGAYALAQLESLLVIEHTRSAAVGIRYRSEELIAVTFRMALEAMRYCVAAGMSEVEASLHCWELEVELSQHFSLD